MFKNLGNCGRSDNIYTSFPPKEEIQAKLEKKTIPTLTVSAHAECRFSVNIEHISGHSETVMRGNNKLFSWTPSNYYTYNLVWHYKISYIINNKKYDLLNCVEVCQSNDMLDLKKFLKETPKERYEEILRNILKREIPKELEKEERESFIDEITNMESIIIDFSFEMEDKSC